jgi:hypothetical protein
MNKLLRKLAEDAGFDVVSRDEDSPVEVFTYGEDGRVIELKKFTELIIEEMYDLFMEASANDQGTPFLGEIKEHFGIK